MLNKADRFKTLKFIRNCFTIGSFPAVIDLTTWQLLPHSTPGRRWASFAYFASIVLHYLYKSATLISTFISETNPPLHQLIFHTLLALGSPVVIFWYYQLYINHLGAFSTFFRITLTGNFGGMTTDGRTTGNFTKSTLQDLVAICMPYIVMLTYIAIIGMYVYDPTLRFLLYSGLPEQFQTWWSFTILLLEETRYTIVMQAVALPIWALQVISFDLVNNQLQNLVGTIGRISKWHKLRRTYKTLRHIQLYVTILNVVNRHIIFSWKLLSIGLGIGTGFACIAHFSDYPVFGVMYFIIATDASLIYTVMYDKAFKIPSLFNEVERQAVLKLGPGGCGEMGILKRQMRSFPRVLGIKVGEFHVLERESTPRFLDYIISNIVSMLVAYRH